MTTSSDPKKYPPTEKETLRERTEEKMKEDYPLYIQSHYTHTHPLYTMKNKYENKYENKYDPNAFYPFKPLPDEQRLELLHTIDKLPPDWQLLLCRDKLPAVGVDYYENLQTRYYVHRGIGEGYVFLKSQYKNSFELKEQVEELGIDHPSLSQYTYRGYYSGVGLITGELSEGLLCIDVDGTSAQPLLALILGSSEIPKTVSWTSGKPGRYQMLFQVPHHLRAKLENWVTNIPKNYKDLPQAFRDKYPVTTEQEKITPIDGELLEFRYNCRYSVLPPSRHPTTGRYYWIHSPLDTKVAPLPERLCELVSLWADKETLEKAEKEARKLQFAQLKLEREKEHQARIDRGEILVEENPNCDEFDDILEAAQELNNRAGIDGFDWYGHEFVERRNGWLEGNCPRHESSSGTSFQLEVGGEHSWRCHGCDFGSVGLANYLIWRETGETIWKGNTHILKPYFNQYGIKLKNNKTSYKNSINNPASNEFKQRLDKYFAERELTDSDYECYIENTEYCSANFRAHIPITGVVAIQAAMGVGKSTALKDWLAKTPSTPKIFIYNRIALGYSQAISLSGSTPQEKIHWIDDIQVSDFLQGRVQRIGLCYDSLHKLASFTTTTPLHLVLDECESGLIHLLIGETHRLNRSENLAALCKLLALADTTKGGCILSDATLRKNTIKYIAQFLPNSPIKCLVNTTKPKQRDVLLVGKNKGSYIQTVIGELAKSDFKAMVASDSRDNLQALEELVKQEVERAEQPSKNIIRLDSDTSRSDESRAIMNNLSQSIDTLKPDLFMFSPTLANGLSIDVTHFQKAYGMFFGVNTPIESLQQMARDRKVEKWCIYAIKGKHHGGTTIAEVLADTKRQENNLTEVSETLIKEVLKQHKDNGFEGVEPTGDDDIILSNPDYVNGKSLIILLQKFYEGNDYPTLSPKHSWYYYDLIATQNWTRANFYEVMLAELKRAGHNIQLAEGIETSMNEIVSDTIEEIRHTEAEAIASVKAVFQDYETAHSAEQMAQDKEIQRAGTKSKILLATGITEDECTPNMVYRWKYDYKGWILPNFTNFLVKNSHLVPSMDVKSLRKHARHYTDGLEFCLRDIKIMGYKIRALIKYLRLSELEQILDLNDPNLTFSGTTPGLKEWALEINKLQSTLKVNIGKEFSSTFPKIVDEKGTVRSANLAQWVLKQVGYRFTSYKKGQELLHTFDPTFLADTEREVLLAGYARKYTPTPATKTSPLPQPQTPTQPTIEIIMEPQATQQKVQPNTTIKEVCKVLNDYEGLTPQNVFDKFDELLTLHEFLPLEDVSTQNHITNRIAMFNLVERYQSDEREIYDMLIAIAAFTTLKETYAACEEYLMEYPPMLAMNFLDNLLKNHQRTEGEVGMSEGELAIKLLKQDVAKKAAAFIK